MMSYNEFRTYLVQSMSKIFADKFEVVAEMSKKYLVEADLEPYEIINLKEKIGDVVYENGLSIMDYYADYVNGKPIGDLVYEMVKQYEQGDEWVNKFDISQAENFEEFKDRVIVRPLRYATNRKILEDFMFRLHGDVALAIYMLIRNQDHNLATAKIHKSTIKSWNLSDDMVFEHAICNTQKLFEPSLLPMGLAITGTKPEQYPDRNKFFMRLDYAHEPCASGAYVLFVKDSPNSAAAIFYPGVAEKLASILQDDLYVAMPFISWVAVHGKSSLPLGRIREMVSNMKRSPLENPKEFLTENIYYYSRKQKALRMV